MPKLINISLSNKLKALALLDSGFSTVRAAAKNTCIAKSTLHDNVPKFKKDIENFESWCNSSAEREIRQTLSCVFEGKSSARDTATVLSRSERKKIDHHKVLDYLNIAAGIAEKENIKKIPLKLIDSDNETDEFPLKNVRCAAFDEIFQGKKPILSFVDPVSGYCYLTAAEDRSEESWTGMLKLLKLIGLDPKTTNTDGGTSLLASLAKQFPNSVNLRDLFHVVVKLSKAKRAFEGYCYGLIAKFDNLRKQCVSPQKIAEKETEMNRALILFDALENEYSRFKAACYCDNSETYVSSNQLEIIVKRIVALLDCAERNNIHHRAIKQAKTYFHRGAGAIIAYKSQLESEVKKYFGPVNAISVLDSICPMIEYIDQIQRSYENKEHRDFWLKKLSNARESFRKYKYVDERELDNAIDKVAQIMIGLRKSNSLVEALNSVIRRFLVAFKSIPSWFCPLFTFYWNHRTQPRGKRAHLKPREILTGKPFEGDWIDIIINRWPAKVEKGPNSSSDGLELQAAI